MDSLSRSRRLWSNVDEAAAAPSVSPSPGPSHSSESGLLCYCTDSTGCDVDATTCTARAGAACFHYVETVYEETQGGMANRHVFGCLPAEVDLDKPATVGASPMQCHAHLSAHHTPKTISCCYDADYCNMNLTLAGYNKQTPEQTDTSGPFDFGTQAPIAYLVLLGALLLGLALILCTWCVIRRKLMQQGNKQKTLQIEKVLHPLLGSKFDPPIAPDPVTSAPSQMIDASSGSGGGAPQLVQKTIAMQLQRKHVVGAGRFGTVWRAERNGESLAVKIFFTTEEASWKREKLIYETCTLRHENILGFRAADIHGNGGITQMLLITDYHKEGSLYEYLKRVPWLSPLEAVRLARSCIAGIQFLHEEIHGIPGKPAIAHRDIKSKNILVRSTGHTLLADFGLAVKYTRAGGLDFGCGAGEPNIQVGTKRYMAPEVLNSTIKRRDFNAFTQADMYSYGLVLWEIARRIEDTAQADDAQGLASPCRSPGDTGQWSASTSAASCSTSTVLPYECPFEDAGVGSDPSFEAMIKLVCEDKARPSIAPHWTADNTVLCRLTPLMEECWNHKPESRLTALNVKKKLVELESQLEQAEKAPPPSVRSGSPTPRDPVQPLVLPIA